MQQLIIGTGNAIWSVTVPDYQFSLYVYFLLIKTNALLSIDFSSNKKQSIVNKSLDGSMYPG